MPFCFWARCFLSMSVCAPSQGKRPPCTSRLMWGAFTCTRTKDGTPWLDTQTSRKVFSSFSPLYWVFAGWLLIILIIIFFFFFLLCVFLLQGTSHRPPHVERREWAEGVHQGQHTPTLPSVVLGGFYSIESSWFLSGVRQKVWDQMEKPQKKTRN